MNAHTETGKLKGLTTPLIASTEITNSIDPLVPSESSMLVTRFLGIRINAKMAWKFEITFTLSQWSSSGNPVAIQCAWHLNPRVHWNATGERILVASVLPVVFQWSSSGFPMVFQCVPIMQINTGSPLGHHWVLASASVVPMAFQCTCVSSGLPVCSNYAN